MLEINRPAYVGTSVCIWSCCSRQYKAAQYKPHWGILLWRLNKQFTYFYYILAQNHHIFCFRSDEKPPFGIHDFRSYQSRVITVQQNDFRLTYVVLLEVSV